MKTERAIRRSMRREGNDIIYFPMVQAGDSYDIIMDISESLLGKDIRVESIHRNNKPTIKVSKTLCLNK